MLSEINIGRKADYPSTANGRRQSPTLTPVGASEQHDLGRANALAIVAHDLRGPLASLTCLMELIEAHSQTRTAKRIPANARRALTIIDALDGMLSSILERVKTSGDPFGFAPSLIDLHDVIESAVTLNQPVAESRSVNLQSTMGKPLTIWGDERLLLQAIENLINNAVKHSPAGASVTCDISKTVDHVIIRISDQGGGLKACDLARAFRPFASLSSKPEHDVRSWGLGLWICRLIIERHGGSIDAGNINKHGGAVFTIRLPMTIG